MWCPSPDVECGKVLEGHLFSVARLVPKRGTHLLFAEEVVEHAQKLQHAFFPPRLRQTRVVHHQVRVDLLAGETKFTE